MPPLFYKDIEPEISSITIPAPSVMDFEYVVDGASSIFVHHPGDDATTGGEEQIGARKQPRGRESKTKSKTRASSSAAKPKQPPKSHRVTWQQRYNELRAYREREGHCLVPQSYGPNPKLGLWVMQQRRQYKLMHDGKTGSFGGPDGERRVRLLDDVGFVWRVARGSIRCGEFGTVRRMKHRAAAASEEENDGRGEGEGGYDEIADAVDFEKYMIEKKKSDACTDEEMRVAWRRRFEMFR